MGGGEAVDRAVGKRAEQRHPVVLAPERRRQARKAPIAGRRIVVQQQIGGRGSAGDAHAAVLGASYRLDPLGRGDLMDMEPGADRRGQPHVPRNGNGFGDGGRGRESEPGGGLARCCHSIADETRVLGMHDRH